MGFDLLLHYRRFTVPLYTLSIAQSFWKFPKRVQPVHFFNTIKWFYMKLKVSIVWSQSNHILTSFANSIWDQYKLNVSNKHTFHQCRITNLPKFKNELRTWSALIYVNWESRKLWNFCRSQAQIDEPTTTLDYCLHTT